MAEASRPVPPPKRGPLGKLVAAILAFSFWLLLGMLGNILFEWVCMKMVWPDEGPAHSVAMVEDELRGLEVSFGEGIFIRRPSLFAREMAAAVYAKVYQDWRLDGKAVELDRRASLAGAAGRFSADAHNLSQGFQDYLIAASRKKTFFMMPTTSRRGSKTISWPPSPPPRCMPSVWR